MKKLFIANCLLFIAFCSVAQSGYKCYPTNWWTGMKWNKVQIMIHGDAIANAAGGFTINYPGVKLLKTNIVESSNYVFLDIAIAPAAKPGIIKIKVNRANYPFDIDFELKPRRKGNGSAYAQGVNSRDLMYLIMPDRFSNGDPSNDRIEGMRDQTLNRDTVFNRHGGDIQGISNHLDYLQDLGVNTLWLNPIWENDMPNRTEHGYAFTNHYKVDPRLGGEQAYHQLIEAIHKRGMKIIQDAVYNHVGRFHLTVLDPPMKDWLNQWDNYTNTSYKDQTLFDPYAAPSQKKIMSDGWFTKEMPDLNERNPFVANFLIQHALWTVEEFGIDGWRIDTYAYNDLEFMNKCNQALMNEYPKITLFGETWVHGVINQSFFCQNTYNIPYKSNLQATTDFQTLWAIQDAMTRDFGWDDGINKLYTTLAQDFVYKDPTRQVIFLDNHDLSRFFSTIGGNMDKYKSSLAWLMTCRGIPQLYYGDEIGMTGFTSPNDGYVRQDFIGGWKGDSVNKFTIKGRSQQEQTIWQYVATLANYRMGSSALTTGKMMQFLPEDGVYVYFRYDAKQTVMIVMNTAKEEKTISVNKYTERTAGFTKMLDVYTKKQSDLKDFKLGSYQAVVLELQK
ncbi:glycoside hydrolase family 13 protein [Ferruginibacter lapsinanis]|uniref:glycoside hydrolase family 13 protein n=1 Tax=Ferruginibacter lapsinanis TaxID=563172 RepID=UPI001E3F82FE|nr:glycoside hydrolase family 13 protein [Ferruginibacter lapsinanis]UEG49320.1 glycoside hydrolase family 13 protein [Ferruginibacter lapsinanis]